MTTYILIKFNSIFINGCYKSNVRFFIKNKSMEENKNQKKFKKKFVKEEVYLYGHANGVRVINGNVEAAIRKWKRIVKDSGMMEEIRERREYKKPTTIRREQRNAALRADWVRRQREGN